MDIRLEVTERELLNLMCGRRGAVQARDSQGASYSLKVKSAQRTSTADIVAAYLAKSASASDDDLRRGFSQLAKQATENPAIDALPGLSEPQLRDLLEAVLERLPTSDDGESTPASATEYERA